ncbi:hypothetical protein TNIN_122721 [Trichonephila inaurata madagascariensis]|uniref:Uncharacterized protein n=1 Tax=Trichonephila inaurata madagascariensis TaxID=2747483 RepID=A0A8X7CEU5_9ARAC|nr:hypothetical protein TNIN_122721 [Trichonephila inaurata madagascariensis]
MTTVALSGDLGLKSSNTSSKVYPPMLDYLIEATSPPSSEEVTPLNTPLANGRTKRGRQGRPLVQCFSKLQYSPPNIQS